MEYYYLERNIFIRSFSGYVFVVMRDDKERERGLYLDWNFVSLFMLAHEMH